MKRKELIIFVLSLTCLISTAPFYIWGWGKYILMFFTILLIIIASARMLNFNIKLKVNSVYGCIAIFIISYIYFVINGLSIGALLLSFLMLVVYAVDDYSLIKSFLIFKRFISIILFPAIILWFIHIILSNNMFLNLGKIRSDFIPNQYKVDVGLGYYYYPFMAIVDYDVPSSFYRFPGPFDEPGVVGTIAGLMLCADKFSLKSKENKTIFVSGLISFSLAFYVTFIIYFSLIFYKNIKRNFLYLFTLSFLMLLGMMSDIFRSYFEKLILNRLVISDGGISGDNRASQALESYFNDWVNSYDIQTILFGFNNVDLDGSSSIKQVFVTTGVVGFLIMVLILVLFFFRRFNDKLNIYVLSFLLIFALSLYQRPNISALYIILIFSFGVANLSSVKRTSYHS